MKTSEHFTGLMRAILFALVIVVVILFAAHAHAQNGGVVGIQAQMIPVFNAQAVTASSGGRWNCGITSGNCPVFPDIGQGVNTIFFCGSVGATYSIDLEWSPNNNLGTFYPISTANYTADPNCHVLTSGSWFPNMRSTLTISVGNVSAWYTASSGPVSYVAPAVGSNGPVSPPLCDQLYSQSVAAAATASMLGTTNFPAGYTTVICGMTISFNGTVSAGNLQLNWGPSNTCPTFAQGWEVYTTANTPQYLSVPLPMRGPGNNLQQPCFVNNSGAAAFVTIVYATIKI